MKYLLIIILIIYSLSLSAQIGINTTTIPDNVLLNVEDKVFVTESGNLGIGTSAPTTKVEIVSSSPQVILNDGSQGAGKVLRSDANGVASWTEYTPESTTGVFSSGINIVGSSYTSSFENTQSYITLKPGKWLIMYQISFDTTSSSSTALSRIFVRSSIADNATSRVSSNDIVGVKQFGNTVVLQQRGTVSGRCVIENKSSVSKDYYILLGNIDKGVIATAVTFDLNAIGVGTGNALYAFRVDW